jgi:mRNA interferase RelE/StbE
MIYEIEFNKAAIKFLETRNEKERDRIWSAIHKLPYGTDVLKMKGFDFRYRLRVGDFRVIYDKFDNVLKIIVVDIGNRGDIYK